MNKTVKQLIFAVSLPCINLLLTNTLVSAKGTGLIFVSNEKGNTLSVLDSKTNQLINTIDTCGRPRGMHKLEIKPPGEPGDRFKMLGANALSDYLDRPLGPEVLPGRYPARFPAPY